MGLGHDRPHVLHSVTLRCNTSSKFHVPVSNSSFVSPNLLPPIKARSRGILQRIRRSVIGHFPEAAESKSQGFPGFTELGPILYLVKLYSLVQQQRAGSVGTSGLHCRWH